MGLAHTHTHTPFEVVMVVWTVLDETLVCVAVVWLKVFGQL